jgi:two-component system sensor histidine kinase TctE
VRGLLYRWLLIPLTGLLLITAWVGYPIALHPVTNALDWALMDTAHSLARLIESADAYPALTVTPADDALLRGDNHDRVYYAIHGEGGTLLAGDSELKPPPAASQSQELFYDAVIRGEAVRVAAMSMKRRGSQITVQVAETTNKRVRLAGQILTGVILLEILLIATVAVLVSAGIRVGLAPLRRLQVEIRARSPRDLRPVPDAQAPVEVQPLVRAINELLGQLGTVLRGQQGFVANAAHQLRTPLAGLRMQLDYALRQENPQEWRRALTMLTPVTERAVRLVHQLLTLARTEGNIGVAANFAATDLREIVGDVAAPLMPKAILREIDLGLELDRAPVHGDALLLGELITNLVDNAITYSPPSSRVTVRTFTMGATSFLEVEDEGPGISEEERGKVMERFYRPAGSAGEGCGLGLAIVEEIAELHGGKITIAEPGRGAGTLVQVTFYDRQTARR